MRVLSALTAGQILRICNGGLLGIDAPTALIPEPSAALLAAMMLGLCGLIRRVR